MKNNNLNFAINFYKFTSTKINPDLLKTFKKTKNTVLRFRLQETIRTIYINFCVTNTRKVKKLRKRQKS